MSSPPVDLDEAESLLKRKSSTVQSKPKKVEEEKKKEEEKTKGFKGIMGVSKALKMFKGMGKKNKDANKNSQKKVRILHVYVACAAPREALSLTAPPPPPLSPPPFPERFLD